jgi:protein arginine kinase activator
MKCQKCGKREADTHVKRVINGEFEEYDLCSECAREMGYTNMFSDFANDFNSLLGSFFGNALPARTQATRCEVCNTGYADIARTGMMGCANCYKVFADQLMPTIRRVHGNTTHCGKHSKASKVQPVEAEKDDKSKIEDLKKQLDTAIKNQEFEKAAQLRDEIKDLEANNG